ncbi:hypothetical protein HanRHA438_Chr05g0214091 [Helianthus annuus]|nr:hypothetical protein HanRHA438_Chr05g0214091 [Helianthus annuus]
MHHLPIVYLKYLTSRLHQAILTPQILRSVHQLSLLYEDFPSQVSVLHRHLPLNPVASSQFHNGCIANRLGKQKIRFTLTFLTRVSTTRPNANVTHKNIA